MSTAANLSLVDRKLAYGVIRPIGTEHSYSRLKSHLWTVGHGICRKDRKRIRRHSASPRALYECRICSCQSSPEVTYAFCCSLV